MYIRMLYDVYVFIHVHMCIYMSLYVIYVIYVDISLILDFNNLFYSNKFPRELVILKILMFIRV